MNKLAPALVAALLAVANSPIHAAHQEPAQPQSTGFATINGMAALEYLLTDEGRKYDVYIDHVKSTAEQANALEKENIKWISIYADADHGHRIEITTKSSTEELEHHPGLTVTQRNLADSIYTQVDSLPEFPGGIKEMYKWLACNIRYPRNAVKHHVQGTVQCEVVVEKDGRISRIDINNKTDRELEDEAIRVIKAMPKFARPGMKDGVPVRTLYSLPISFKLN